MMDKFTPLSHLLGLIPKEYTYVGTVIRVIPPLSVEVEIPSGDKMVAYGTDYPVLSRVFVSGGKIVGPAPDLPSVNVHVII